VKEFSPLDSAIAGPVINNRVRATNLPWTIDAAVLSQELNVAHIVLLNDLGAWGHSIEYLDPKQFLVLNEGKPEPGGTRALLAAGTGLGESLLVWDGKRYQVVPSEGGHSDFAPHTEQQIELLRFMKRRLSPGQLGINPFRPRIPHPSRISLHHGQARHLRRSRRRSSAGNYKKRSRQNLSSLR